MCFPTTSMKIESTEKVFLQLPLLTSSSLHPIHLHTHSLKCSSFCFRLTYLFELVITPICTVSSETLLDIWIYIYFSLFSFLFSFPSLQHSYFIFFNLILFFNFTILYWFCHISKWIRHRYTCVPRPEHFSLLPPHTIPLGLPSALAPNIHISSSF